MKFTPTPEQIKMIKSPTSGKVTVPAGEYYYVPYWFSPNPDGTWQRMTYDELPAEVIAENDRLRNFINSVLP